MSNKTDLAKRQTIASESQAKSNRIALKLSIAAIIVSLATFGFSIYSFFYPRIEQANVIVERVWDDYETQLIETDLPGIPAILPVYWKCLINNQGDRTISIIDYAVVAEHSDARDANTKRSLNTYSNLKLGLYENLQAEYKLPTVIEAGKSATFLIKIGIVLDERAYNLAKEKYSKKTFSIKELSLFLAEKGVDVYGNTVTPIKNSTNQIKGWDGPNLNRNEQLFHLRFTSSRNNYFNGTVSWYPGKY